VKQKEVLIKFIWKSILKMIGKMYKRSGMGTPATLDTGYLGTGYPTLATHPADNYTIDKFLTLEIYPISRQ
jgi:hypothetical protein